MRLVSLIILAALACSSNTDPLPGHGVLETNATSYVAVPLPTGAFDYAARATTKGPSLRSA